MDPSQTARAARYFYLCTLICTGACIALGLFGIWTELASVGLAKLTGSFALVGFGGLVCLGATFYASLIESFKSKSNSKARD